MNPIYLPANFSPCRKWRYTLYRDLQEGQLFAPQPKRVQFVGLNPSTADEKKNDPTVRRCMNFARDWGFTAMWMTNVFGFRATDPRVMQQQEDPQGKDNTDWILDVAKIADLVVCCWGVHGDHMQWGQHIAAILINQNIPIHCLGTTFNGQPKHPLFLPGHLKPVPYEPRSR